MLFRSVTPATKTTLTTPSTLPSGVYKIKVNWMWNHSAINSDSNFGLWKDSAAFIGTRTLVNIEASDTTNWYSTSRTYVETISGAHTYEFQFWNEVGGSTTQVSDVFIEFCKIG